MAYRLCLSPAGNGLRQRCRAVCRASPCAWTTPITQFTSKSNGAATAWPCPRSRTRSHPPRRVTAISPYREVRSATTPSTEDGGGAPGLLDRGASCTAPAAPCFIVWSSPAASCRPSACRSCPCPPKGQALPYGEMVTNCRALGVGRQRGVLRQSLVGLARGRGRPGKDGAVLAQIDGVAGAVEGQDWSVDGGPSSRNRAPP